MPTVSVECSRCHKTVDGVEFEAAPGVPGGTAGFYRLDAYWGKFADEGETILCDSCMWHDPRYQAVYGEVYE